MANVQIPNLPAAISLNGTELIEAVQAGTSVKVSVDLIESKVQQDIQQSIDETFIEIESSILSSTASAVAITNAAKDTAVAAAAAAAGVAVGNSYWKAPVRLATTRNITLSGIQTVDGRTTATGQRIGVIAQTTRSQNGIYIANDSGVWTRATDTDSAAEISGATFLVTEGQHNRNKFYKHPTSIATFGTDPVIFIEEPQGGSVLDIAGHERQVLVDLGDSNIGGRPGWRDAILREVRHPRGRFANWTHHNTGVSGYTLNGIITSLASGNQNAAPVDVDPSVPATLWDGNVWAAINAFLNVDKGGIIRLSLGYNDLGLKSHRDTFDRINTFGAALDQVVYALLTILPRVGIQLLTPAPFVGEDFIQGGNVTDWLSMSLDGTIDGGAARASEVVRSAYLSWVGKHPRVQVWDSAELFGTRIDDKAVNGQDPEGQGALMDDSLHPSGLAMRRVNQISMRLLGQSRWRQGTGTNISTADMNLNTFWGAWFFTGQSGSIQGSNSRLSFTGSKESLHLEAETFSARRTADCRVPAHMLDAAEFALMNGQFGDPRRLLDMKRDVKLRFLNSGNEYTATGVTLSQIGTSPEGYPRFIIDFLNCTIAAGDLAQFQPVYIYTTSRAGVPYQNLNAQFNICAGNDGSSGQLLATGGIANPYNFDWYPTVFNFQRGIGTNAIDVKLYAQNQSDGRLVDGPLNSGTAPGMIVAEGTINNGVFHGALTLNATNWPNGFLFKSSYRLVGRVTSTTLLVGLGGFTARA